MKSGDKLLVSAVVIAAIWICGCQRRSPYERYFGTAHKLVHDFDKHLDDSPFNPESVKEIPMALEVSMFHGEEHVTKDLALDATYKMRSAQLRPLYRDLESLMYVKLNDAIGAVWREPFRKDQFRELWREALKNEEAGYLDRWADVKPIPGM